MLKNVRRIVTPLFLFASLFCLMTPLSAKSNHKETAPQKKEEATQKEEQNQKQETTQDLNKISEALGHLIGKNLESLGFELNVTQVIKGMQDSIAGKQSPMNESETVQAISMIQETALQKLAQENLEKANLFMKENAAKEKIVELEAGKLQYEIKQEGSGESVQAHFSPLIRYSGQFLNGKVFGSSKEEEMISLDETIPGLSKGIVGMKEGEKRTIFIHPDLGYGKDGYLPPNSLLTFEVEVIKANAPKEQKEEASVASKGEVKAEEENLDEIAIEHQDEQQAVR